MDEVQLRSGLDPSSDALRPQRPERGAGAQPAAGATAWVHADGTAWAVTGQPPPRRGGATTAHDGDVRRPMPGAVLAVRVAVGDQVEEGEVLLVVEAMEMEHALAAPVDGTVADLTVRAGNEVVVDQLLATVTAAATR